MSTVARIHPHGALLSKKQLAQHLGRSERWVELRVREGMPSVPPSARFGGRRFSLADVEGWLGECERVRARPVVERVAVLEREMAGLRARLRELEGGR